MKTIILLFAVALFFSCTKENDITIQEETPVYVSENGDTVVYIDNRKKPVDTTYYKYSIFELSQESKFTRNHVISLNDAGIKSVYINDTLTVTQRTFMFDDNYECYDDYFGNYYEGHGESTIDVYALYKEFNSDSFAVIYYDLAEVLYMDIITLY